MEDGDIFVPKKGKVCDCKLWVEDEKSQVGGYVAFSTKFRKGTLKYEPKKHRIKDVGNAIPMVYSIIAIKK